MKPVILSADGERKVYAVPDAVAENLEQYCEEFCCQWLVSSPDAKKHRKPEGLQYTEEDFIEYLNRYKYPDTPSTLVENLGWIDFDAPLPKKYRNCPWFNF